MAAKKHKERKSTISVRFLSFLVALGALVLPSVFSYAEDLTTLDGKTFTNITEVAKYPNQIFFTCNEKRISVAISNMPEEFLAEHGIQKLENPPSQQINVQPVDVTQPTVSTTTQPILQLTNPVDLFLWQNRESDLDQMECSYFTTNDSIGIERSKQWCLTLKHAEVDLDANSTTSYNNAKLDDLKTSQWMHFDIGQEGLVTNISTNFLSGMLWPQKTTLKIFKRKLRVAP